MGNVETQREVVGQEVYTGSDWMALEARPISLVRFFFACAIAGGVQYGWALQLSLLTPYVQTLGISHSLSSVMWLCGPVTGFLVPPIVGAYSDQCHSKFGRRRPFIFVGCLLICIAVLIIGFSSDIGYRMGDTKESCSTYVGPRMNAVVVFVIGFWIMDISNNIVQGPARALMADISGNHGCSAANAIFCLWMAIGNILGYTAGASNDWHRLFPCLRTNACCEDCANLKGAFLLAVILLLICMTMTLIIAKEVPLSYLDDPSEEQPIGPFAVFSLKSLPEGMPSVLLVTALTWLSWFPIILYDTDWMAREVYHGEPSGNQAQVAAYDSGVRAGAFGLLLNAIVLAVSSFMLEPLCRCLTARIVWVISNFQLFALMVAVTVLSSISMKGYSTSIQQAIGPSEHIRVAALVIFALLGLPLAVLYSIPFAYAAQLAANEGGKSQGVCIGVLNVSIVLSQVIVALGAGPLDSVYQKGNLPAFALAAAFAFVCIFVGLLILPKLSNTKPGWHGCSSPAPRL